MKVDIDQVAVSLEALEAVPGMLARRLGVLPLTIVDDVLYLAMDDPDDLDAVDQIESLTGYPTKTFSVSGDADFFETLQDYYPLSREVTESGQSGPEPIFQEILNRALKMRASDIHIFPEGNKAILAFRIDSNLVRAKEITRQNAAELISYIKVRAGMNIAEKRLPLDGSLAVTLRSGKANLRIATIPTIHGEHLTLRLLSESIFADLSNLETLGLYADQLELVRSAMYRPQGLIYLSGPTGSGKTTTMYSILKELLHKGGKHIVSVEDPVESIIPGLTQIPVNTDEDPLKFHKVLRSVMRHDPDVILIGETRDAESAQVAQHAAMTGHLVLSTVHANDSMSVVERLLELNVERSLLASSMSLSIAQRLLRRPCAYCLESRPADADDLDNLELDSGSSLQLTAAPGCPLCRGRGSAGRIGVFELLPIGEEGAAAIADPKASRRELKQYLRPTRTLLEDGINKMQQNLVLYDEVLGLKRG